LCKSNELKTEFFIARRIIKGSEDESRLSKPIVIISLASIIVGVAIMLISVSVVTGFQQGIREKVIGFGSHIQVTDLFENSSMESSPVPIEQDFYPNIMQDEEGVKHIQMFAYKPAILQSTPDTTTFQNEKVDTIQVNKDIQGVLFKGISDDFDWSFFDNKLVAGKRIDFSSPNKEVMISASISKLMGYDVGDELDAYFIMDNGPKKRKFTVCGIYDTGFEEFDKKFIFTQIEHLQKLNNWGVQTLLTVNKDSCYKGNFILEAITKGGNGDYRYKWNNNYNYSDQNFLLLDGRLNEEINVVSTDFGNGMLSLSSTPNSIPDTASALIQVDSVCGCNTETLKLIKFKSENEIEMPFGKIEISQGTGTHKFYTGGFEIILEDWDELDNMDEIIDLNIPGQLTTKKITEMHPDIFAWLNFLDINILIIISLILVVSLINMITSLLVMILDKSNMIGILKAIGATNRKIRRIFMINSFFLLTRGLFWGNVLGIGLILLQHSTGIMTLNPEVYYLDVVPVNFDITHILMINLLTIIICVLTLYIPSLLITKIDPVKAIKFD